VFFFYVFCSPFFRGKIWPSSTLENQPALAGLADAMPLKNRVDVGKNSYEAPCQWIIIEPVTLPFWGGIPICLDNIDDLNSMMKGMGFEHVAEPAISHFAQLGQTKHNLDTPRFACH
jgi:hypothetical protein